MLHCTPAMHSTPCANLVGQCICGEVRIHLAGYIECPMLEQLHGRP